MSSDARARNSDLDRQLANRGLASVDVRGDGNCLFRAISMSLYGREGNHCTLRDSILTHLENNSHILEDFSGSSVQVKASLRAHIKIIRQSGSWAGEEAILATADFLKSEVHVCIAVAASLPLVYKPTSVAASVVSNGPASIAFYEPGHYKSVVSVGVPADRLNYLRRCKADKPI